MTNILTDVAILAILVIWWGYILSLVIAAPIIWWQERRSPSNFWFGSKWP